MKRNHIILTVLSCLSLILVFINIFLNIDSKANGDLAKVIPWIWFAISLAIVIYCGFIITYDLKFSKENSIDDYKHILNAKLALLPFHIVTIVVCISPIFEFGSFPLAVEGWTLVFEIITFIAAYLLVISTSIKLIKKTIIDIGEKKKSGDKTTLPIIGLILLFLPMLDALGAKLLDSCLNPKLN